MIPQLDNLEELGPWFHNLHLPDGTQTAPNHWLGDFPRYKWNQIAPCIPSDLAGLTALDIGCNGGFYSIELAKRGARVLAIDIDERYLAQARWAAREFKLEDRVTLRRMEVYEVATLKECFDLVMFTGVFYHLRYPLLALDMVASKVRRMLVFQTLTLPGDTVFEPEEDYPLEQRGVMLQPGWPVMAFVEKWLAGDPTNWWVPNTAAVLAMLRSAGLELLHRPEREIFICKPGSRGYEDYQRVAYTELEAALGRRNGAATSRGLGRTD